MKNKLWVNESCFIQSIFIIASILTAYIKLVYEEVKSYYNQFHSIFNQQGYLVTHIKLVPKELKYGYY